MSAETPYNPLWEKHLDYAIKKVREFPGSFEHRALLTTIMFPEHNIAGLETWEAEAIIREATIRKLIKVGEPDNLASKVFHKGKQVFYPVEEGED